MVETKTSKTATSNGKSEPKTRAVAGNRELTVRQVHIKGLTEIMFDRYPGDNDTKLEPWQKLYLAGEEGRTVCLPSVNIMSFLSAQNTDSAPKRILDKRKYKDFALACSSYVMVMPNMIPFLRDDQPIEFGRLDGKLPDGSLCDTLSGVWIKHDVARLPKGIPNPKIRPVLNTPWELEFEVTLFPNQTLQEQQLLNIFTLGMQCLGVGTFRGQYGKSDVILWE